MPCTCSTRASVRPPRPAPAIVTGVVIVSSRICDSSVTIAWAGPRSARPGLTEDGSRDGGDAGDQGVEHPVQPLRSGAGEQRVAGPGDVDAVAVRGVTQRLDQV